MADAATPGGSASGSARAGVASQLAVLLSAALFFGLISHWRAVDDDEGYYLLAGRAVLNGELPYRDFFFPQQPLGAYVYGAFLRGAGPSIAHARLLSVLLSVGTALGICHGLQRHSPAARWARTGRAAAVLTVLLFCTNQLVFVWFVTAKTFALSSLLAVWALNLASPAAPASGSTSRVPMRSFAAGLLAGLCLSTRGLMLPVLVVVCWSVWRAGASDRRRRMSHCLAGMAIGVLPLLALALADPAAFYFDTFTYHARRYPGTGWVKDPLQKLAVVWHVFASPAVPWPARLDASGLQLLPLLGFSVLSLRRVTREASAPWLVLAVLLGLVALLPSPVHAQYFCVLVPPLTVTALLGWTHSTRALRRFGVVCALVSVASSLPLLHGTFKTQPWQRPTAVDEVGRAVARVTTPDDIIAAHWPAYLVSSDRTVLPDAQSEFVRLAGFLSTPAEHERFKLYTEESMAAELRSGAVRVFVAGHYFVPWTSSVVVEDGWQQAAAPPGVTVWVR